MGARVLLAVESISLHELLPHDFSSREAEVTCVSDGISARRLINDLDPDLLIAEIALSGVSGYELCEYVREHARHRGMPVILVDHQFEAMNQAQACKAGVDIYLARPFEPRKLVETVAKLIRREKEDRAHGAADAPLLFSESLSTDIGQEMREAHPAQSDSRYVEGHNLNEAAPEILIAGPREHARAVEPRDVRSDARSQPQPSGVSEMALPQAGRPRGKWDFPVLLGVMLLGLILGSLALLAPKSSRPDDEPEIKHGVVSASEAGPGTEGSRDSQAESSSQAVENSGPVASESPHAEEAMKNPSAKETVHSAPLSSNTPAAVTAQVPEPFGGSTSSTTGRAHESADDPDDGSVNNARPITHAVTAPLRARNGRRAGAGAHLKRGGGQMMKAGKNLGSGFKHFGIAGKNSAVWSGKKAGAGVKGVGKAMKGLFN